MTEIKYNPMSKEFQDECKKLGLTGRQLTAKYQKEGKYIEKGIDKRYKYTNKQLLQYLIQFYEKYGRPPVAADFINNPEYPSFVTYQDRFGSWSNALKLVELDVESMVKKGIVETSDQKARFSEIIIRDHFDNPSIDLAGENCNNLCDGICPNGKTYDVKSSKLYTEHKYYFFNTRNKYKKEIEIYYLLGFNEDYTELEYGWRIPGEIAEKDSFYVGSASQARFNIDNMEEYDITGELREVLTKYGFFKLN